MPGEASQICFHPAAHLETPSPSVTSGPSSIPQEWIWVPGGSSAVVVTHSSVHLSKPRVPSPGTCPGPVFLTSEFLGSPWHGHALLFERHREELRCNEDTKLPALCILTKGSKPTSGSSATQHKAQKHFRDMYICCSCMETASPKVHVAFCFFLYYVLMEKITSQI